MNNVDIVKKSRKPHRCESCGFKIEKGSSYVRRSGVWQDRFYSVKLCTECNEIMDYLFAHFDYSEGIHFNQILDSSIEHDHDKDLRRMVDNVYSRRAKAKLPEVTP